MLDGFEFRDRPTNLFRLDFGQHPDADSGQHVFEIVRALQRNLCDEHNLAIDLAIAPDYVPTPNKRAARGLL